MLLGHELLKCWRQYLINFLPYFVGYKWFEFSCHHSIWPGQRTPDKPCCTVGLYWFKVGLPHNSLAPGIYDGNFKSIVFELIIQDSSWGTCSEIALMRIPQNLINEKSPLVQVMAWRLQTISHYLSSCWPGSICPYGVTMQPWVEYIRIIHFNNSVSSTIFQWIIPNQMQCGAVITRSVFSKILKPVRARYGVSVRVNSQICSERFTVVLYAISYCTRPRYNGTTLYRVSNIIPL